MSDLAEQSEAPRAQRWATEGVAPLTRPGLAARLLMRLVVGCERLNLRCAKLGSPYVYDNADFPWVAPIEREWGKIRAELDRVMLRHDDLPNVQDITTDARAITQDSQWKIFLFVGYGVRSQPSIMLCPETWRLMRTIPGLRTAMFSVLEPGKRLPPHRGPYNGVLRLHLGLIVPEPGERQAIRIGPELRTWHEGKVLIFDDAYEHEFVERDRSGAGRAVRRFRQAATLSGEHSEPCAAEPRALHAVPARGHRKSAPLGTSFLRGRAINDLGAGY